MNGQELHAIYWRALRDQGVGSDTWDQLEADDRAAWDTTAAEVEARRPLSVAEAGA